MQSFEDNYSNRLLPVTCNLKTEKYPATIDHIIPQQKLNHKNTWMYAEILLNYMKHEKYIIPAKSESK